MKRYGSLLLLALLSGGLTANALAQSQEEQVIEYLREHPEFLLEHPELLQRANALKQQSEAQAQVESRAALVQAEEGSLLQSEWTPIRGNPKAPYTLIEFSDYQCVPCKSSFPAIESFVSNRPDIRLIQLQLPIYGPYSTMAARAALVANKLGDFEKYHVAMMQTPNPIDLTAIEAALQIAGVSADEFSNLMNESGPTEYLKAVKDFSIATNVVGTPSFLLNGMLLSGAVTEDQLNNAVAQLMNQGK